MNILQSESHCLAELSAFYDGLDTGIMIVDSRLRIFFINDWIRSHLPLAKKNAQNLSDIYEDQDSSFVRYIIRKTIRYRSPHILSQAFHSWVVPLPDRRFPDKMMRQGVRIIPFSCKKAKEELALIQIKDNSETVLRVQGMKFSQEKLSEKKNELEKSNLQLQKEISERILAEKNLREARDRAESASKAKSEFLAKMSHELRTPLNSIMGFAQLLRKSDNLSDKQKDRLGIIDKCGKDLLDIINNLLDLSKIESGHSELNPETICLRDFLQQISDICGTQVRKKNIRFHTHFAPDLPEFIYADETKLRQILFNIIGNAVKFTPGGEVSVSVSETPEGIRFQVDDTGIGIDSEQIDKIFIPFHQIHNSNRFVEGTGLGLSISHSFLQLMGSQLQVRSMPGKGSSFTFTLAVPENIPRFIPKSYGEWKKERDRRKKIRILVADDIELNRAVLKETLEHINISVLEAENGQVCIEKAKQFRPDMILMDVKMPETDGLEAAREIRTYPELSDIPIIAISASVGSQTQKECMAAGMNSFLEKPFGMEDLQILVSSYFFKEKQSAEKPECENMSETKTENRSAPEMIPPPGEELRKIIHLTRIGDVKDLKNHLEKIAESEKKYCAFAEKCLQLLQSFELEEILRICGG